MASVDLQHDTYTGVWADVWLGVWGEIAVTDIDEVVSTVTADASEVDVTVDGSTTTVEVDQ